jgi:hypothetical protein
VDELDRLGSRDARQRARPPRQAQRRRGLGAQAGQAYEVHPNATLAGRPREVALTGREVGFEPAAIHGLEQQQQRALGPAEGPRVIYEEDAARAHPAKR